MENENLKKQRTYTEETQSDSELIASKHSYVACNAVV